MTLARNTGAWRRQLLLFCILGAVAFIPAISGPFAFDDIAAIDKNSTIERLWPPGGVLSPPKETAVSGRPLVNATFAINNALNRVLGVAPARATVSYHLVNLALHVFNALLLFVLLRRTVERVGLPDSWQLSAEQVALAATIIWVVHPIQTDTVDYLTQRTELLVSTFYLAVLVGSFRANDALTSGKRLVWSATAVVCCLLGAESKEVMVTAPVAVMLYDAAFVAPFVGGARALLRRRRWFYACLWLALAPLVVSVWSGVRSGAGFRGRMTAWDYLVTQGWAIWHYLVLLVWPSRLTFDYGQRPVLGLLPGIGLLLLSLALIGSLAAWRTRRWLGFIGIWFFLLLAPSSSFVPIQTEIAAERRVYLAIAAPIVLIVLGGAALSQRLATSLSERSRLRVVALGTITVVLVALSARRSMAYEDPATLWADAIGKRPSNARAYDNLAAVVLAKDAKNADSARILMRHAIAVDSTYIQAWINLAVLENQRRDTATARALLQHAVRIDPDNVPAARDLGLLLSDLGETNGAIQLLERVARVTDEANVLHALGSAYAATGRIPEAIAALQRTVALDPTRVPALEFLGAILVETGQPAQAIAYLDAARQRGVSTPMTLALGSVASAQLGRADAAMAHAKAANQIGTKDPRVYLLLGRAMLTAQNADAANEFFTASIQIDPASAEAFTGLAIVAASRGNIEEARRFFRQALAVDSSYQPARSGLSRLR